MPKRVKTKAQRKRAVQQVRKSRTVSLNSLQAHIAEEIKNAMASVKRPPGRPKGSTAFQRVSRARQILAQSSTTAARLLVKAAKVGAEKGDSSAAEFILRHVGATNEEGELVRPIVTSIDRLEGETASKAPVICIGWITNSQQPALTPDASSQVIDVTTPAKAEHV